MDRVRSTVRVSNIPLTANAQELFDFFQVYVGFVFACDIFTFRRTWKSKGVGRVQFETVEAAGKALRFSTDGKLGPFRSAYLVIAQSFDDIMVRPVEERCRIGGGVLHVGFLEAERHMVVLESWDRVRMGLMPDRNKIEICVEERGECYKMEFMFGDIDTTFGCSLEGTGSHAILLKLKYAPKIYHRISGPFVAPKFRSDRYHVCKEDFQFLWVRSTDFSVSCSIGQSSYFCLEVPEGLSTSEIRSSFPLFEELGDLIITKGKPLPPSILVPIISCPPDTMLEYEILFQLNSLVHAQKISYGQVNPHLIHILSGLPKDAATMTLLKLRKMKSTCYDPVKFIQRQLNGMQRYQENPLPSNKTMSTCTLMQCYRVLVTPLRVYFLGPELETSNYVVRHYADHASNFLRVSFVEEDWSKLAPDAISTKTELGIFSEPYRTGIYGRILSILRDGIQIGMKNFEFLAFSASQLRASSVWMFASTGDVTAASIRQWMGHFDRIRSVSKCAARMGQLFSSSWQTFNVLPGEVQKIPDVDITTDGINYCFSDGIGKLSLSFANQVAQHVAKHVAEGELSKTPSAFQIRYGGYKGVVAVDRSSLWKLSLRPSMLKFNSENTMLCVTNWSKYMPCHLNREIICLLSTLGIQDENFEALQREEMCDLDNMLTNREVALKVLESMSGGDTKTAVKMLIHGYEPNIEPYLSMMLRAHREFRLSGIRSKCRIFVPKGRILIGCLDETGTLSSGQVYVRVTMTSAELQDRENKFFEKVDNETAVVVGKVVATKNPCLHPGDIRILEAIYDIELLDNGLVDCIVFPQKGERPHPNECSGGDLDGDMYFVCWDDNLIPSRTDMPMDYIGRRPRIMDHEITLQEIQEFFIEYMTNDTLGVISTTHLVHADSEPSKARSPKCLQLANLHSMAVDFAKTGAPAEMPRILRPKEYPDFMERWDRPSYISHGILGKLYRIGRRSSDPIWSKSLAEAAYDVDLEVTGFEAFLELAADYKNQYAEKLSTLMNYYGAEREDEILTGDLGNRSRYLQREKKADVKDRILEVIGSLRKEVRSWFIHSCNQKDYMKMASAWYHVTYHPNFYSDTNFLSFPWILCDDLLKIKSFKRQCGDQGKLEV